ncbi:ABC transporter permease [Mesorhizobium sp. M2E.F.Ca.ET.209.01.1.1]|uniref:ABC transporter permease n=1 Tax=Mesorhizobium sp. M2E.F.Ca.ET.209.01.1.1 TaxID=2500526 RepID=UPI000FD8D6F0|nr:ABC transporter permease [Mesorhizobium sp. M2E.F.Ca.ET.209.01.1.1]TGS16862.1 ABC transporter permease [Mesorhizobium sp. M2E.F.Ca.ET.209.01.1.1]
MSASSTQKPRPDVWRLLASVVTVLVFLFLLVPIAAVLPLSFSSGSFLSYPMPGLSLRWYEELLTNYKWLLALKNSAVVGVGAAALSTFLGLSAAIGMNGLGPRARAIVNGFLIAPLVMPVIIMAVGLYLFLSDIGLAGTIIGMILAHTVIGTPYVVISATAALQNFDMQLIRAAKSLGASPWMAYRRVMLPAIRPAIVAGSLFAFVASFDEVVIVLFLAGPGQVTLPVRLFEGIRDELTPVVIAAAVVMISISIGLMAVIEILRRKSVARRGMA